MRKKILVIFVLALVVRLAFFVAFAVHEGSFNFWVGSQDSHSFINEAVNVYAGRGFSAQEQEPFAPDGIRTPVVPLILGLFVPYFGIYVLLQIVAASLSVVLLYKIGDQLFGSKIAFWAAIIFALDPLSAFHSLTILSETWFTFFFLIGTWFFVRFWKQAAESHWKLLVLSAVFLGVTTLTRPVGIVPAFLFGLAVLLFKKLDARQRIAAALTFLAVFSLTISPWLVRNYQAFGKVGLSYIPAYNWYHFNARMIYAQQEGISKEEAKAEFRKWESAEIEKNPDSNGFTLQSFYFKKALEVIKRSPLLYLFYHGVNFSAVYLSTGKEDIVKAWTKKSDNINFTAYVMRGWSGLRDLARDYPAALAGKLVLVLFYGVILAGFILSVYKRRRWQSFLFLLAATLIFGITTGAVAEPRFRVPVQGFIILMFVYSTVLIFNQGKNEDSSLRRNISA